MSRIAHKIQEFQIPSGEEGETVQDPNGVFRVTDMVSTSIIVKKPDQIVSVYKTLLGTPELNMVRCKNNLLDDNQFVALECIYLNRIVV